MNRAFLMPDDSRPALEAVGAVGGHERHWRTAAVTGFDVEYADMTINGHGLSYRRADPRHDRGTPSAPHLERERDGDS